MNVLGCLEVNAKYRGQHAQVPLLVVHGAGPNLFGRDWLSRFQLDWKAIHVVQGSSLQSVLQQHQVVFSEGLGKLRGYEAKIQVDPDVKPRFCKARQISYAMKTKLEEELDRLVKEGTLEPVQFANWASPIVPVLKADKSSVWICGDFSRPGETPVPVELVLLSEILHELPITENEIRLWITRDALLT